MIRQEITVNLNLECGAVLEQAHIVFHTSQGTGKVIWICHALTANSDPEDWWPEMARKTGGRRWWGRARPSTRKKAAWCA